MNKKIILTNLLLIVSFAINAQNWQGNTKKIKGNKKVITTTRVLSNFKGVSVSGNFNVNLIEGKEEKLTIEAEENITPYIISEIEDNILKIKYQKGISIKTNRKVSITVSYQSLEALSLAGSGDITNQNTIHSNHFKIAVAGSGNISLKINNKQQITAALAGSGNINIQGNTNNFTCTVAGSGNIKAYDLTSENVVAKIAGSGNIKSTVKHKINANVAGSGHIYYKGSPTKIDKKSNGSGSIINKS